MPSTTTYENLSENIKVLQSSFTQILTSDCHYKTHEITNHIKHINDALDNIKIEYELRRDSNKFAKESSSDQNKTRQTNIKTLLAKGGHLAQELNTSLHTTAIKNKEHNQLRELHSWACNLLIQYLQDLYPLAYASYVRLDDLAHTLGVTDRFVGYQNNLNRGGNQPVNFHAIWVDRKLPKTSQNELTNWTTCVQNKSPYTNTQAFDSMKPSEEFQPPDTMSSNVSHSFVYANDYDSHLSKAGLVLKYPGNTEFMDQFQKPDGSSHSISMTVAQPDYGLTGRPLAHLIPQSMSTEYTSRYTYPEATKLEKYPWLRP